MAVVLGAKTAHRTVIRLHRVEAAVKPFYRMPLGATPSSRGRRRVHQMDVSAPVVHQRLAFVVFQGQHLADQDHMVAALVAELGAALQPGQTARHQG